MIKFSARQKNGRILVGFGLSGENIRRLKVGQPILFSLSEAMADHLQKVPVNLIDVTMIYGEKEADLRGMVAPLLGPGTQERLP